MRRRVSFRLECARAARLRRRSFREISRGFVKVFCGERASERASERVNEQVSELSNSAKVARRLWKLMSRTVHALVLGSLLFLSLIFVGEITASIAQRLLSKRRELL